MQAELDDLAETTKESPAKILEKAFSMGLESLEKETDEPKQLDDDFSRGQAQESAVTVNSEGNLKEYTLFCGRKIILTKEESDHFKDETTSVLEACITKCPDEKISGDINNCPVFQKTDNIFTLFCGKSVILTKEESNKIYNYPDKAMKACELKCPDKEVKGNVGGCPVYQKASDDVTYGDDPDYQAYVKSNASKAAI